MKEKNVRPKNKSRDDSSKIKGFTDPENANVSPAHGQADKDMKQDPDLNQNRRPEEDKDEGELARLEGED
jgi:hypothetical protein